MALIKFFTPQSGAYSKGGAYNNNIILSSLLFSVLIKLTELTSFDFDYIRAVALYPGQHLLASFSQNMLPLFTTVNTLI